MCKKKTYEQEEREKRIQKLSFECSVASWLMDVLNSSSDQEYKLDFDIVNKQVTVYFNDKQSTSASVIAADLIGFLIQALSELDDLVLHGCVIVYKNISKSHIILCNKDLTNNSHTYDIEAKNFWEYLDCNLVANSKLEDYIKHEYMYLPEYIATENLKETRRNLRIAIVSMIITLVMILCGLILGM